MRIIHTSDWHLGQHFFGKSRALEHQQFLNWLIEQVKQHQVAAIIVAGDIFDTGNPPSYARELYFDFVSNLQKQAAYCQLVILAGNHDSTAMIGESKQLLSKFSTYVIPSASTDINAQLIELTDQNNNQAIVCAVPFIRPRDVLTSSAGQSAKEKQQQLQQAIAAHYQALYQQAEALAQGKFPIIATGHLTTVGATTSDSVREIYIGTLDAFPANQFPKADYIALGHIHQMQNVGKSDHIRYCGSPIPLSFDEAKQDKHVLLVDVKAKDVPVIEPLVIPRFQAIAMVKTTVEQVVADIKALIEPLNAEQTLWLDIEIESSDYHSDMQAKITEQLQAFIDRKKIEILLIRRSKQQRQLLLAEQEKITLEELLPLDVFNERLKQTDWPEDDQTIDDKKTRLTQLFQQALTQMSAPLEERQDTLETLRQVDKKVNTMSAENLKAINEPEQDSPL